MDESKVKEQVGAKVPTDHELRVYALQVALNAHVGHDYPEGIIDQAREFYSFLKCDDRILDRNNEPTEDEESNVIPFELIRLK